MAQSIACPACRTKLLAPPDVFGQSVRCTKCGDTFIASAALSPYLEGLPPEPKSRRAWLLGGAVLAGLLLITGLVLGVDWLNGDQSPDLAGGGNMSDPKEAQTALESIRPKVAAPLFTSKGLPIVEATGDGPDPVPGIDDPLLRPKTGDAAATKKKPTSLDDVTLTGIKWEVAPNVRLLVVSYSFQNGATPSSKLYKLKVRVDNGSAFDVSLEDTMPNAGVITFNPPATLGDKPGRLPKVEAWFERSSGIGAGQKVSNTVSTE